MGATACDFHVVDNVQRALQGQLHMRALDLLNKHSGEAAACDLQLRNDVQVASMPSVSGKPLSRLKPSVCVCVPVCECVCVCVRVCDCVHLPAVTREPDEPVEHLVASNPIHRQHRRGIHLCPREAGHVVLSHA